MRILYGLLVFIFLTACTVGPNYHPPEVVLPAKYSSIKKNDSTKTETHFWYAAIKDPVLLSLINQAINGGNFDVQTALANLRESRARLGIANADYFPQVDMTAAVTRDRFSANQPLLSSFPPGLIPLSYTDYNLKFDASWEIDLFGHTRRSVEASRATFESEIENQRNVRIAVIAEVASTYTLYRIYQQRILIANQTIASYGKTAHLVNLQMKSGSATGADLDRVQSDVLSAKASLPTLQAEAKATLASLAVLVGQTPEDLFICLNKTAPIPHMNSAVLSVGLPSDLLRRRPDIRIAERNLAAANAHIGVAVANQFPRFQLIGDLGSDTTQAGTYFDKASILWSVGPQVYIPTFEQTSQKDETPALTSPRRPGQSSS